MSTSRRFILTVFLSCLVTPARPGPAAAGHEPAGGRAAAELLMVRIESFLGSESMALQGGKPAVEKAVRPLLEKVTRLAPGSADAVTARKILEVLDGPAPADDGKPLSLATLVTRTGAMEAEWRRTGNRGLSMVLRARHLREKLSWQGKQVEGTAPVWNVQGNTVTLELQIGRGKYRIFADARDGGLAAELMAGQKVRFRGTLRRTDRGPGDPFCLDRCEITLLKE
jgi:hypothetical protein